MDNLASLSLGRKLALGAGVLLLIDTFFSWQNVSVKLAGVSVVSASANAWHGFWGVLLGLLTIAFLVWVAAKAFGVELPVPAPEGLVTLALGALVLIFAVMKTLTESYSAWASYVGIVLAAAAAGGSWLIFQDSGEALPSVAKPAPAQQAPPPADSPADEPPSTTPV